MLRGKGCNHRQFIHIATLAHPNKIDYHCIYKLGPMVNLTSLGKLHITLSKILRFERLMSHFKVERCIFQTIPILSMLVTHSTSLIPLYFVCIFF